ncbi:MAG: gamma carbonic anhydrase family protein [Firmicutes bacterium]|nr:gamma carbonic anhydrase family protein [Bacillota bacterium]
MIATYRGHTPQVAESAFVAENATIVGNVTVGENAGVWFGAVIRSEGDPIVIGEGSNIQDNCVLHIMTGVPTIVGKNVSVGHGAILHSTTVGDNCMIGMGAILLNKSEIGEGSFVGAGAVVSEGQKIPPNSLVVGAPARVIGPVSEKLTGVIEHACLNYKGFAKSAKEI